MNISSRFFKGARVSVARGFTLVELMVVVAIITLLTSLIMVNFVQTRGSARDGKRLSDLSQIQLALEQYFDRCSVYPLKIYPTAGSDMTTINNGCPTGVNLGVFMSKTPVPPASSYIQPVYDYTPLDPNAKGGALAPVDYMLHVKLEYQNPIQANGLTHDTYVAYTTGGGGYTMGTWTLNQDCYNSTLATSLDYCLGPK